jgi:hypothetical protein
MTIMQDKTTQAAFWKRAFFERNNFYFGKLMTARDFTDEQGYFNEKRWMVNRLGLGWGVLCGLKVRPHKHDKRKVIVEPGLAIDQYGHEILVGQEETVELTSDHDDYSPDKTVETLSVENSTEDSAEDSVETSIERLPGKPPVKSYKYYISIKYEECGVNPSAIPIDTCDGYKEECFYNRIREGYRLIVSRKKPAFESVLESDSKHGLKCEAECHRFLQDPSPVISNGCPDRPECEAVPLASICYNATTETTAMDIDMSMANRKLAFSNEILYEMLSCLRQEVSQGMGGHDRRQHVPLLASTIKGLKFQDGKIAKLDWNNGYKGKYPFRLTSDGDYIWITDRDDNQIWRINRMTNKPITDQRLYLDDTAWGIAYDGKYMWITHHKGFRDHGGPEYGKLTRVNVCTLERRTFGGMPRCETLPDCYRFPEIEGAPGINKLKPYPGEIVLHDGDIYVAHDLHRPHHDGTEQTYNLSITRIDPVKGCIVETIDVPESDNREQWSRIKAMASDGDALWITYRASSRTKKGGRVVVRKITKHNGKSVVGDPYRLNGEVPEHMVFDGTRLWITHNDGVSAIETSTGEEDSVDTRVEHTALAYGGGTLLWAASPGKNEAFITLIDIFTEEEVQRLELIEVDPQTRTTIEISDMQFDGTYIYVAYHLSDDQTRKGVIHRLLP